MTLDSLWALLKSGVSDVSDVQPSNCAAFGCNGKQKPDVSDVSPQSSSFVADTSDTADKTQAYQLKPLLPLACTPDTSDTSQIINAEDEAAILSWLAHIGETDPQEITAALAKCASDPDALAYCLDQAAQMPEPDYSATCGTCSQFQRIDHVHLGHCSKGEPEAPAGLWDTTWRWCMKYELFLR
jgi:hypothetical protein